MLWEGSVRVHQLLGNGREELFIFGVEGVDEEPTT